MSSKASIATPTPIPAFAPEERSPPSDGFGSELELDVASNTGAEAGVKRCRSWDFQVTTIAGNKAVDEA
jgi:hypothetical protein